MDWNNIIYPALSLGGLGLVFGLGLGVASKKFAIEVNPLIPLVREALPGANCGGCGYAGCDAFARSVVEADAPVNGCPVGGKSCAENVARIMGKIAEEAARKTAFVKCHGTCDQAKEKYVYEGIEDCTTVHLMQGKGSKSCEFGCIGFGNCINVCQFGALHLNNGIAVVDEALCTACGQCTLACPKKLITLVPDASRVRVACSSLMKGKEVKESCNVGCISCGICEKNCSFDAIHVTNQIAVVDYDKCTQCLICVEKCPTKAIIQ